jgi:hypothetical protein
MYHTVPEALKNAAGRSSKTPEARASRAIPRAASLVLKGVAAAQQGMLEELPGNPAEFSEPREAAKGGDRATRSR